MFHESSFSAFQNQNVLISESFRDKVGQNFVKT